MIKTEEKLKLIKSSGKHAKDVGSAEVQVGILTARIKELTEHLQDHPKDAHSRRGLLQMVGKRKRLLSYLKSNDFEAYAETLKKNKLRA